MTSARLNRSPASGNAGGGINPPYVASPALGVKIPAIDEDLLVYLQSVFTYVPSADHDLRALDRAVGHIEVIKHLVGLYEAQQEQKGSPL